MRKQIGPLLLVERRIAVANDRRDPIAVPAPV
jgi:hypothetical protein